MSPVLAFSTNTWTAIGSVATAIAVVVAAVSLWFERRSSKGAAAAQARDNIEDEAAQIRERVKMAAFRTQQVAGQLEVGNAIIDAAWHTAQSVRAQSGAEASADVMRAQIGDPAVALTATIEGWFTSAAAAELREALTALNAADDVAGDLNLFSPIAELLRRVVNDGYPPLIFMRLFLGPPAEIFLKEHQNDDVDALTRALAAHLHSNSSAYFLTRYQSALDSIVSFSQASAAAMVNLDPYTLVGANRAKAGESPEVPITAQLREKLGALQGTFPDVVIAELAEYLQHIETDIDKASAEAKLMDLQSAQKARRAASGAEQTDGVA